MEPREASGGYDALRRLDQASAAAERLLAEAARAVKPPPAGWQVREESAGTAGDFDSLLNSIHSIGQLVPPDLRRRLGEALRELLLALRALIDWYLERLEQRRAEPVEVQDIPIL